MSNVVSIRKAETVTFSGGEILAILTNKNEAFFSLRQACDTLGIAFTSQRKKVMEDPILSKTCFSLRSKDTEGRAQRVFVLHKEALPTWLMSISINKVKPDAREKVIAFKHEAYKALDLWFNKELKNQATPEQLSLLNETPSEQESRYQEQIKSLQRQHARAMRIICDHGKQVHKYLTRKINNQESFALRDVAHLHQINEGDLSDALMEAGVIYRKEPLLLATKEMVENGMATSFSTSTQVRLTKKGLKWVQKQVIPSLEIKAGAFQ